ncbi:MAG: PD-(D/E)XK nuclease family protein [Candidatus Heimdallarchaeota archaeon]|nr:PD-(D/E)XK nuclease family protein [Candidatus Heimdallarchaeota archaeon]
MAHFTDGSDPMRQLIYQHRSVKISDIGIQLYCEMALLFTLEARRKGFYKTTMKMKQGIQKHKEMTPVKSAPLEEKMEEIENEYNLQIFPVKLEFNGIIIRGEPDGMIFQKGNLLYLIEIKSGKKIHFSAAFQAMLYMRALQFMGFDLSVSKIMLIHDPGDLTLGDVLEAVRQDTIDNISQIRLIEYNQKKIEIMLDKLLMLWTADRGPKANPSKNKCTACTFSKYCDFTIATYHRT